MPTDEFKLRNLRVKRVDLVDEGANQEAHIVIAKHYGPGPHKNGKPQSVHGGDAGIPEYVLSPASVYHAPDVWAMGRQDGPVDTDDVFGRDVKVGEIITGGPGVTEPIRLTRKGVDGKDRRSFYAVSASSGEREFPFLIRNDKSYATIRVRKAMTPDPNHQPAQPSHAAPAPAQARPAPSVPQGAPQTGARQPEIAPKPGAPAPGAGGAPKPAAPGGAPMGMSPESGKGRLARLSPQDFTMTTDSKGHKEWQINPDAMPEGVEDAGITAMAGPEGMQFQWMIDPVAGPPITGMAMSAAEALMMLREMATNLQAGGMALPQMGMPGAEGMGMGGPEGKPEAGKPGSEKMGGAPTMAPLSGPNSTQGSSLIERLRERLASGGAPKPGAAPNPGTAPAAGGGAPKPNPMSPGEKPDDKVRKALDAIAADLVEVDILKAHANGGHLRDILTPETLEILKTSTSAGSAKSNQEESMDKAALDALPDEVLDYIETLETQVSSLAKAAGVEEDPIAKALTQVPADVADIIKAQNDEVARLRKSVRDAEIAKANDAWIAKARALDGVIDDPATFGPQLRAMAEFDPEFTETLMKSLEQAANRIAKGALFGERGHSVPVADSVEGRVAQLAKSLRDANPALSDAEARAEVWERNPDLYDAHRAEQLAR